MKAYILTVSISYLLCLIGEKIICARNNKLNYFIGLLFYIISLFFVSFLAGIRDLSIGTDIHYYFYQIFYDYSVNNTSVLTEYNSTGVEIGFLLLMKFASKFNDINIAMFIIEFFTALPIYIIAVNKKKNGSLIVLVFLLTMYVRSFNLIRQSLAMTIIILATYCFINKKINKTIILTILAISIHYSAIISVAIYYLWWLGSLKKKENKIVLYILMYFVLFMGIFGINFFLKFFKYSRYLGQDENQLNMLSMVKKIFWLVMSFVNYYIYKNKNKESNDKISCENIVACNLFTIDFILSFLSFRISNIGRLGYYFINLGYILLALNFPNNFKQKKFVKFIFIIILIIFWINMTAIPNSGDQTYPYKTDIVSWLN